ncbi:uncharacterized [Tachysurus ichikawai]
MSDSIHVASLYLSVSVLVLAPALRLLSMLEFLIVQTELEERDFVSGPGICLPIVLSCRWVNMPSVLDVAEVFHQQSLLLDKADKRTMGQRAGLGKVRLRLCPPPGTTPQ